jgi:hypothetical protein
MIENKRARIQALRLLTEIEERRSKLLGLDMPTKHASTDPTGQKEFKKRILEQRRREAEKATIVDHEPLN